MNYDYKQTNLSKAILGGLFAGLIACAATELFNIIFREATEFSDSEAINVQTLIFVPIITLVVAGIIYFIFSKFVKRGRIIYTILFILITIVAIIPELNVQSSQGAKASMQFKWLFISITIIIGFIAAFVLPYITKHDVLVDN